MEMTKLLVTIALLFYSLNSLGQKCADLKKKKGKKRSLCDLKKEIGKMD